MKIMKPLVAALFSVCGSTAMAGEQAPIVYAQFTKSVPHLSLAECPSVIQARDANCLVAVLEGKVHVIAFSKHGSQKMLEVRSEAGGRSAADFKLSALN